MSSGGASSLLHSHEDHNLHCALFGRKDFIVIDEKYRRNFDFKEKVQISGIFSSLSGISFVCHKFFCIS